VRTGDNFILLGFLTGELGDFACPLPLTWRVGAFCWLILLFILGVGGADWGFRVAVDVELGLTVCCCEGDGGGCLVGDVCLRCCCCVCSMTVLLSTESFGW
jgi:hypothetical protein